MNLPKHTWKKKLKVFRAKNIPFFEKIEKFSCEKISFERIQNFVQKNIFGENPNFCAKKYRFEKKWEALHCISEKNGSQITNNVITNLTF